MLMQFTEYMGSQPLMVALLLSLAASLLVAIAGVVPSTFVTAANLAYFGFWQGLVISILGEALGAIASFILYRKGIKKLEAKISGRNADKWLGRLKKAKGTEAFLLVILLRIFPFAPSGVVTLAASYSRMAPSAFAVSSTLGKIPSLLIEAYSIKMVLSWKAEYQLGAAAFTLIALVLYYLLTNKRKG